jgi:amino acid efflux transporter
LASDGVLPRALARGVDPGQVPAVSLCSLAVMTSISFALAALGWLSIEFQIGAASACFTAVTAFGLAAGVRLLPRRTAAWYGVVVAAVVMLVVLLFSGWALLVPAGLGAAAFLAGRRPSRRLLPQPVDGRSMVKS